MDKNLQIIYVDMDAFYASIEQCENVELKGKAVIIGGDTARSVVSAASYEARQFGVHSAMSIVEAKKRCPHAIILPVNMKLYKEYSNRVMEVLRRYSPCVEQVSIYEACLDMTEWHIPNTDNFSLAKQLQQDILNETNLSASIGVATSKGLAKMASDFHKPNGITVIESGHEKEWLAPHPIRNLRGVGIAAMLKMEKLRIKTIGQFAEMTESQVNRHFGQNGIGMWKLANGIDESVVEPFRERKSIGREYTFLVDQTDNEVILRTLLHLSEDVAYKLVKEKFLARGITLKVRYYDFCTITRSMKFIEPNATTDIIYNEAVKLYEQVAKSPIRLIGVTAAPLTKDINMTLNFNDNIELEKAKRLEKGRQAVVNRFGVKSISRARLYKDKKRES